MITELTQTEVEWVSGGKPNTNPNSKQVVKSDDIFIACDTELGLNCYVGRVGLGLSYAARIPYSTAIDTVYGKGQNGPLPPLSFPPRGN